MAALPATTAAAPSLGELRAQVARIQAEVASIDQQVGAAAEAYNGAVYHLDQINTRIEQNRADLIRATRNLRLAQERLADRVRAAYMTPPPTKIQLILSSGSASALLGGSEALERVSTQDGQIVRAVTALRAQRIATRNQLRIDRVKAKTEVQNRARQRDIVAGLLRQRQAVLSSAKGALARELAAENAREAARRAAANRRARAIINARTPAPSAAAGGSRPATTATVSGGGSARNAQAARIAMRYLGVPYVWGGGSPSGFDCSGLASYAYAQVGVGMAHYTGAIWTAFPRVQGDLQPGDLVFFSGLGHMGIYIGGGMMVHAPHTGDVVRVSPMAGRSYVGAVRP